MPSSEQREEQACLCVLVGNEDKTMKRYFEQCFDYNDPSLVSAYDELPLWSAPFGLALLNTVKLRANMKVLDIGCGAGFPLLELAQRLGATCQVFGLDPWDGAIERAKFKIRKYAVNNAAIVSGVAEKIPFDDNYFDLIVSNNGLNNVTDCQASLAECFRACCPGAEMVITMNLPETMMEFYSSFEEVLKKLGMNSEIQKMYDHISSKRRPIKDTNDLLIKNGFQIIGVSEDSFKMRFLDGSAMLNHYFIRLAFLDGWKNILQPNDVDKVFTVLEDRLNRLAEKNGQLCLTIPFACIDCRKPKLPV
jgi:arsenite methyltransferase